MFHVIKGVVAVEEGIVDSMHVVFNNLGIARTKLGQYRSAYKCTNVWTHLEIRWVVLLPATTVNLRLELITRFGLF